MYRFIAVGFFIASTHCSLTASYYEELIINETTRAQTFQLPENNEEYRFSASLNTTYEFGSYDFVIIGAGTAGSVVATRLSEVADYRILLLEAGGEEDDFNQIPAMLGHLLFSERNWGYYSSSQKTCCLGMIDQKCFIPRGKLIGGSSSINAMMYVRGNSRDFDKWESLGNPGWSYKHVLPYFLKSENSQIDGDVLYHGKGGLWNIEYAEPVSPLYSNFIKSSIKQNISLVDYNGSKQVGSSQVQYSTKRGKRQSTGTAFLNNARKRPNLKVITNALVTKITINKITKTATGVKFVTPNRKFYVRVRKEVILSAGTFNSAQILMLSGIGPREHLNELEINLIADLPVGQTLYDHPVFPLYFQTNHTFPNTSLERNIEQYLKGLGDLTKPQGIDGIGFIKSGKVPNVEYMFVSNPFELNSVSRRILNFNEDLAAKYFGSIDPQNYVLFPLVLLHEKSKGKVTLKSANPIDFPNIDLNFFDDSSDIEEMIEGIKFVINMTKTSHFQSINATLIDIPICTNYTKYTKPYWECQIRHISTTLFHPCGTAPMGPVVDHNLKIHGVKKIRVIDASVFPTITSGHLNSAVVMVAEKTSDAIKKEYRQ